MATVKGDVHDIGKNIVGVVLGCNNYEVIDLGVMVPCDRILQEAIDRKVDIIGLSGLITPSLDEMVYVAQQMQQRGLTLPLLIGGATTSRQHTAVKIAPEYQPAGRPRAGRVARRRCRRRACSSREQRPAFDRGESRRAGTPARTVRRAPRPADAVVRRRAAEPADARLTNPRCRRSPGRATVDVDLAELVPYIDWTFFFAAWELKGRFPAILDHPQHGEAARDLYEHAQKLLDRIVSGKLLRARGVYGFWPANSDGDDIVLYAPGTGTALARAPDWNRHRTIARFPMLRQQEVIADDKPNRSLADFVAPVESGVTDYLGAFAVTAGPRRRRPRPPLRGRARRLLRHHRQGAGRSAGRGVCRVPARAGAA